MGICPRDGSYVSGKKSCQGCPHFDMDDQDDGDVRVYVPVCTYKDPDKEDTEDEDAKSN